MTHEIRERFERTTCGCALCRVPCKHMPGSLIPGDLEAIAEYLGEDITEEWLTTHFRASEGAKVITRGMMMQVPSMVPAQKEDGSCIFLDEDEHCTVHPVSPFGCSHHDIHMEEEPYRERSNAAINAQIANLTDYGRHTQFIRYLAERGFVAPPLSERRGNFEQALKEAEHAQEEDDKTSPAEVQPVPGGLREGTTPASEGGHGESDHR